MEVKSQVQRIEDLKPSTYKGIYAMHKYWSKKPPNIVAYFIEKYSKKGDIVLDPFSGYGVTGIEALRLGRKTILIDLNPIATFISRVIGNNNIHKVTEKFVSLHYLRQTKISQENIAQKLIDEGIRIPKNIHIIPIRA